MTNPWSLKPHEVETLRALIYSHGLEANAALLCGIERRGMDSRIVAIKKKMNAKTRTHAILMWDRWARAQKEAAAAEARKPVPRFFEMGQRVSQPTMEPA